jgi:hypothetical protein
MIHQIKYVHPEDSQAADDFPFNSGSDLSYFINQMSNFVDPYVENKIWTIRVIDSRGLMLVRSIIRNSV